MDDDPRQGDLAGRALQDAEQVALPIIVLCEFAWALSSRYRYTAADIASAIRSLIEGESVVIDHAAAEAGLGFLDAGRDFADGVIAYDGRRLGGAVFLSFDRHAVQLLRTQGELAELLA